MSASAPTVNSSGSASCISTRTSFLFASKTPRLIVPSSGGGTKLTRTLRAGDAFTFGEGVGLGDGVGFGVGDAEGEALEPGDSWAIATETNAKPIKIAALTFFVIVAARCVRRIFLGTVLDLGHRS